jgi:hypothetical protein
MDRTDAAHRDLEISLRKREIPTFPQRLVLESVDKNVGEQGTS